MHTLQSPPIDRTRRVPTRVKCECGAVVTTLSAGESVTRDGQPQTVQCPSCPKTVRYRVSRV